MDIAYSSPKALIIDLDGTIVDSLGVWSEVDRKFFAKRGLVFSPDYAKEVSAMDFREAAVYTNTRFSLGEDPDDMIAEWFAYAVEEYASRIKCYPGVPDFLNEAKAMGLRLALATASDPRLFTPVLQNNGIYGCFDAFVTTQEAGQNKCSPDVYLLAAERLSAKPSECIVFEDLYEGLNSAYSAGFRIFCYKNGHGFGRRLPDFPAGSCFMFDDYGVCTEKLRELLAAE